MQVMDADGFIWIVDKENSIIKGRVSVEIGERIKIIGNKTEDNYFRALEIRPWMGMKMNKNSAFIDLK